MGTLLIAAVNVWLNSTPSINLHVGFLSILDTKIQIQAYLGLQLNRKGRSKAKVLTFKAR